jgi:crotonobetainyl-CoA:carnitine CoA-transferase CaiB-like acyl-CoA transferase
MERAALKEKLDQAAVELHTTAAFAAETAQAATVAATTVEAAAQAATQEKTMLEGRVDELEQDLVHVEVDLRTTNKQVADPAT